MKLEICITPRDQVLELSLKPKTLVQIDQCLEALIGHWDLVDEVLIDGSRDDFIELQGVVRDMLRGWSEADNPPQSLRRRDGAGNAELCFPVKRWHISLLWEMSIYVKSDSNLVPFLAHIPICALATSIERAIEQAKNRTVDRHR